MGRIVSLEDSGVTQTSHKLQGEIMGIESICDPVCELLENLPPDEKEQISGRTLYNIQL